MNSSNRPSATLTRACVAALVGCTTVTVRRMDVVCARLDAEEADAYQNSKTGRASSSPRCCQIADSDELNPLTEIQDMTVYKFALSYYDPADAFVGILLVGITADSAERASREIEKSKRDPKWMMRVLGVSHSDDIDGIVMGEHVPID
jgi:hypothetical protein